MIVRISIYQLETISLGITNSDTKDGSSILSSFIFICVIVCELTVRLFSLDMIPTINHCIPDSKKIGYIIIHKPIIDRGVKKGNCDAELVLHAMIEFDEYDEAIVVSGDGDFYCLVEYLLEKDKLAWLLIPNKTSYSSLLRKFSKKTRFVNLLKKRLEYKKPA